MAQLVSCFLRLCYTDDMIDEAWIQQVKRRGLAVPLTTVLDVLEPLGPLGAQLLWIAQPVSGLWGGRAMLAGLAEVLEQPGGVERLRQRLESEDGGNSG